MLDFRGIKYKPRPKILFGNKHVPIDRVDVISLLWILLNIYKIFVLTFNIVFLILTYVLIKLLLKFWDCGIVSKEFKINIYLYSLHWVRKSKFCELYIR